MKKIVFFLVVLVSLKWEVKAQVVEWVRPILGRGSVSYINDSLIYLMNANSCGSYSSCISNIYIYDASGNILKSKNVNVPIDQSYGLTIEPQQKFVLPNNKVMYSQLNLILDQNLTLSSISGTQNIYSSLLYSYPDSSKIRIKYTSFNRYEFNHIDKLNNVISSNLVIKDSCYYAFGGFFSNAFIDRNKSIYFSPTSSKQSFGNTCYKPSTYLPTNKVGGVIFNNYSSDIEAIQNTVIKFDSDNKISLLAVNDPLPNIIQPFILPEYFQEDSRGYIYILSRPGHIGKYQREPWRNIWIQPIFDPGNHASFFIDGDDNIYATSDSSGYQTLNMLDTLGNFVSFKKYLFTGIANIQSDNKNSLYVVTDYSNAYSASSPPITYGIIDCHTLSGNVMAKLYTGTLPSSPKLTKSGLFINSNYPRGVSWYRNDSLLTSENDTFTLALRDGKYTFKAFCKQDTVTFKGISVQESGILQAISIPGATYQWFVDDIPIPNAITPIYAPNTLGKYTVTITFTGSQALYSAGRVTEGAKYHASYSTNVSGTVLVIDENTTVNGYFSIFPNPATQTLTIKTAGFNQMPQASILNSLGQEVTSHSINTDQTTLDVSSYPKGIYSIKVGNQVQKLVVE